MNTTLDYYQKLNQFLQQNHPKPLPTTQNLENKTIQHLTTLLNNPSYQELNKSIQQYKNNPTILYHELKNHYHTLARTTTTHYYYKNNTTKYTHDYIIITKNNYNKHTIEYAWTNPKTQNIITIKHNQDNNQWTITKHTIQKLTWTLEKHNSEAPSQLTITTTNTKTHYHLDNTPLTQQQWQQNTQVINHKRKTTTKESTQINL